MSSPWYRMHANLADTKVVWRAAQSLKVSGPAAAGHLAFFWGKLSQHAVGGSILDVPDAAIEQWAGWTGKAGRFAAFVREHHSIDGIVNDYEEFNGKLEERRARDRARKSALRDAEAPSDSAGIPQEQARNSTDLSAGSSTDVPRYPVGYDTIRVQSTVLSKQKSKDAVDTAGGLPLGDGKPPRKQRGKPGESTPWMALTAPVWTGAYGGRAPAHMAKVLRPCVADIGDEAVAERLAIYCAATDAQYASLHKFAATIGSWTPDKVPEDRGARLLKEQAERDALDEAYLAAKRAKRLGEAENDGT